MCAWLRSNQSLIQKGNHYLALPGLPLRLNFPGASFSSLCVSPSAGPLRLGWERVRRVCRRRLAPHATVGRTPPRSGAQPDLRGRAVAEQGAVPGFPQPSPFCCSCFRFCLTTLCPCALQNGKIRTFFLLLGDKTRSSAASFHSRCAGTFSCCRSFSQLWKRLPVSRPVPVIAPTTGVGWAEPSQQAVTGGHGAMNAATKGLPGFLKRLYYNPALLNSCRDSARCPAATGTGAEPPPSVRRAAAPLREPGSQAVPGGGAQRGPNPAGSCLGAAELGAGLGTGVLSALWLVLN